MSEQAADLEGAAWRWMQRWGPATPGAGVDVALSGGRDSVALLAALVALRGRGGWRLRAHHVRHGLREDDGRDAALCAEVCEGLGVALLVTELAPGALRQPGGGGTQARARAARYAALLDAAEAAGAGYVATAHHADDALETSLMRWLRGAGLEGLAGVPARGRRAGRRVVLLRPLLEASRGEVDAYVAGRALAYRDDPSNARPTYLRNRVRQRLIPALEALAPGGSLGPARRTVGLLRADAEALSALVEDALERLGTWTAEPGWYAPLGAVTRLGQASAAQLLRHAARRVAPGHAPEAGAVGAALERVADRRLRPWRDGAVEMGRDGGFLFVRGLRGVTGQGMGEVGAGEGLEAPLELPRAPARGRWGGLELSLRVLERAGPGWRRDDGLRLGVIDASPDTLWLDARAVEGRLRLARAAARATLRPPGMGGKRKRVDEIGRELGMPRLARALHPLLADAAGALWFPGGPRDGRGVVRPDTLRVLRLELIARPWYLGASRPARGDEADVAVRGD